jgi:lipopolysaccharide export LptBFGC system permease protein LptF
MSHWLLDLIVHTPDMPLWSDASLKLGFGLWNNAVATYVLEAVLLLAGLWLYLRATSATTKAGKYGMGIFVVLLLLVNIVNIFGPLQGDSKLFLATSALAAYLLFAAVAFWLDRKRT